MNNVEKFSETYEKLSFENQCHILDILQTLKYSQDILMEQQSGKPDGEK